MIILILGIVDVLKHRLAGDENEDCEQEPRLAVQERGGSCAAPDEIRDQDDKWMANKLGVPHVADPAQSFIEIALLILQQMPHIIVDSAHAILTQPRTPDHPIEEDGQQGRSVVTQHLDDVWVALEQVVDAIVVTITIRPEGKQIFDDGYCCLEITTFERPCQRRDAAGSDLHDEHPVGAFTARGARDCFPHQLLRVVVDGFHHNCASFVDCPHQHLRNQTQRPAKRLHCCLIRCPRHQHLNACCHERAEELSRNAVTNMTEPKC
mmetsp:Transcript_73681/g.134854  ORF Transcript_73681/g.134854 Transcript_73681/m.134854 type:complete len:265 (+) Transcript_73681:763-1557(+)